MTDDKIYTQRCKIRNIKGLHARASRKLVMLAERFDAQINVAKDGQRAAATSIMDLLMLAAGPGSVVTITAQGIQAREGLEAVSELIEKGFEEDTDGFQLIDDE